VNPTTSQTCIFPTDGAERQLGAPNGRRGLLVDLFDVGGKDSRFAVCAACCQEHVVERVPVHAENGGADGFFEKLGDPPVVFLVKGTDSNGPSFRLVCFRTLRMLGYLAPLATANLSSLGLHLT